MKPMARQLPMSGRGSKKNRLWLLLILLPLAGLFWKEYPSLIRYIKIERM
jgi:hypothetical protein